MIAFSITRNMLLSHGLMAMLAPGLVAHVLGRRVLALDGFEAALADGRAKQRMWAYLKQLPPLGAPY